jgi:hypothetical protein
MQRYFIAQHTLGVSIQNFTHLGGRDDFYVLWQLALTSPTSGGRSVGIVRSRTQATEFFIWSSVSGLMRFRDGSYKGIVSNFEQITEKCDRDPNKD